jgi:hypothetical protein
MTYSVHQHWDRLKVCAVGISYPPEFYSFIKNSKARSVMERIAQETEEDYQNLINLLHKFDVKTVRPNLGNELSQYFEANGTPMTPHFMTPRDYTAMIGDTFYTPHLKPMSNSIWNDIRGEDWTAEYPGWDNLESWIKQELEEVHNVGKNRIDFDPVVDALAPIVELVQQQGNNITETSGEINSAMITRIGRDLYHGTDSYEQDQTKLLQERNKLFPNCRNHVVNSGGHSDATFCPVKPGLIVSLRDIPTYQDTFPDWEVVYLPGQSWDSVMPFLELKEKNRGKFWVPGEEYNDDFTNVVNTWLNDWVGYVEETVFDVNMLVIDEHNVIVNNENDQVFEAFARHGITPHICNFRHRYFWDGGIHCITSDLHREGTQQNYFPERD